MKSKVIVCLILAVFLGSVSATYAQDKNQKKIEKIQKKIEKQHKKLQELSGVEHEFVVEGFPINEAELETIREKAEQAREKAMVEVEIQMNRQREEMEAQREAMNDQRREMEHQVRIIREKNLDKLKDLKGIEMDVLKDINGKNFHYYYKTPNFEWKGGDAPMVVAPGYKIDVPEFKGQFFGALANENALNIEKDLTGESISADFPYEVKESSDGMFLKVTGSIEAGKVLITVKKPDGSVFNEYTLSPLANVTWNQTIDFENEDETTVIGKWVVTIAAENAKGNYKVHLSGR